MAVRFRLPALMREAAAEFAATFILLVSKRGLLIYGGGGGRGVATIQQLYSLLHLQFYKMYMNRRAGLAQWWERSSPTNVARVRFRPWARFSKVPKSFRTRKPVAKSSNLMIVKLFYWHILNMKRVSLHTKSSRCLHLFVFRYRLIKNRFAGPKGFRGFRETGPWCYMWVESVVGSRLASKVFLRVLRFSSLHKNDHSKFQFYQNRGPGWKLVKADVTSF